MFCLLFVGVICCVNFVLPMQSQKVVFLAFRILIQMEPQQEGGKNRGKRKPQDSQQQQQHHEPGSGGDHSGGPQQ